MNRTDTNASSSPATPPRQRRGVFSPRDVLYVLFRHRRKALLAFAFVAALASAAAALLPDKYQSEAKLLVTLGRESGAIDPTATFGEFARPMQNRDSEINSEVSLLGSRSVAEAVAVEIGPDRLVGAGFADTPEAVARAADLLQRKVLTSVVPDSATLVVSFAADDPVLARDVVAAHVEAYRRTRQRVYRNTSGTDFFASQRDAADRELNAIRSRLRDFKDATGVADVAVQRQILLGRIGALETAVDEARAVRAAAAATADRLEERTESMPRQVVSASTTGAPNSSIETLRTRLGELRLQESDVSTRYVETSPVVRNARAQVAEAERLLAQAEVAAEETLSVNPVREQLVLRAETERALAGAQDAKLVRLLSDLEVARGGLARLNDAQITIEDLQRQADLVETNLREYATRFNVARIDGELEQADISNIRVIAEANLPARPSGPDRPVLLLAGLVMATLAAGATAFAADALDHSVARPDDLIGVGGDLERAADACVSIPRLRSGQAVAKGTADYFDDLVHSVGTVFGTAGRRGTDVAVGTRRQARGFLAAARYITWSSLRGVMLAFAWVGNKTLNLVTRPFARRVPAAVRPAQLRLAAGTAFGDAVPADGSLALADDAHDVAAAPFDRGIRLGHADLQDDDLEDDASAEPLAAPTRRVGRSVRLVTWAVARDARAWWHRDERPNLQVSDPHQRTAASAAVWRSARGLAEQLVLACGAADGAPASVAVVAARPGSGTSTVAGHLAGVLAERALETPGGEARAALLIEVIDAGERRATPEPHDPLPEVRPTPVPGLDRLRIDTVRTADVRRVMDVALQTYRHVVLDVPAVYVDADGRTFATAASEEAGPRLSALCDATVLVMHADRLRREAAARCAERLARAGARLNVVVLNKRRYPVPTWLYRRA